MICMSNFITLCCILTKLYPFLKSLIYIQSNIRQYVVSALYILYLWNNCLQTLLKCATQQVYVLNPCYLGVGLRSRSHLEVKIDLENVLKF